MSDLPTTPKLQLPLAINIQKEIDGIGMGVLSDGTPFLNLRGLARLCGVQHSTIIDLANNWDNPRSSAFKTRGKLESQHNIEIPVAYKEIISNGITVHAFSDFICMGILEYYAFDAGSHCKPEAQMNFRLLAQKAIRQYIYDKVGYKPSQPLSIDWQIFHDRISKTYNAVPDGYFGVFKEMSDIILQLGQSGVTLSSNFVPDISVGIHWGKHWIKNNLSAKFGARKSYPHAYPDYFPQAKSGDKDAHCYPEMALGEFRRWLRDEYIGDGKLTSYLKSKEKDLTLPSGFSNQAIRVLKNS